MTKLLLSTAERNILRSAIKCTDEAGLPIMSGEAEAVMVLEKFGLIRIAGQHQNRVFVLPAGREVLGEVA